MSDPVYGILLAHLPQWSIDQPPLGIAYLTGFLRAQGIAVTQRDLSIEFYAELPEDKKFLLESHFHEAYLDVGRFEREVLPCLEPFLEKWADQLASSPHRFIGFTVLSTNRLATAHLAAKIRRRAPEKVLIVGGPYCTRYEGGLQIVEDPNIDYVVPGEGEEACYKLVECLARRQDPKGVPGLLFKRDGQVVDTGERPLIKDIDALPYPQYDGFPLKSYRALTLPILGSRGCIYKCAFCSETVLWRKFRFRSGANLFGEFKHQHEFSGAIGFYIVDSLINGNIKELEKFCDLMIESGLKLYWGGKASIRQQMSAELLRKMYRAGCRNLDYGLESGSPKVVKDMHKGFDHPLASRVLKDSADAGIEVGVFMLVGFPTESDEDYALSKRFLAEHQTYLHHVTPGYGCGIQPGSELYYQQEKYGVYWKDGDWYSEFTTPEVRRFRVQDFRAYCGTLDVVVT